MVRVLDADIVRKCLKSLHPFLRVATTQRSLILEFLIPEALQSFTHPPVWTCAPELGAATKVPSSCHKSSSAGVTPCSLFQTSQSRGLGRKKPSLPDMYPSLPSGFSKDRASYSLLWQGWPRLKASSAPTHKLSFLFSLILGALPGAGASP